MASKCALLPGIALLRPPDTVFNMNQQNLTPVPPGEPAWDILFTRMAHAVIPKVEACAHDLARRFNAIGLNSSIQVRPMPRGLSTFLALVGQRGLICFVDLTLVDGMAAGHGPCAWLEVRLLDACGDVVAGGLGRDIACQIIQVDSASEAVFSESLDRAATGIYVAALAHFDLLRPLARHV